MKSPKFVFYVEDNFENRVLVRRLLQSVGYQVGEAKDAADALDQLQSCQPDLILMDMSMLDMDGYSLARQLKTQDRFSRTPIVAVTANVLKGDREKSIEAGCDGYLEKPIEVDTFINQINNFLNKG